MTTWQVTDMVLVLRALDILNGTVGMLWRERAILQAGAMFAVITAIWRARGRPEWISEARTVHQPAAEVERVEVRPPVGRRFPVPAWLPARLDRVEEAWVLRVAMGVLAAHWLVTTFFVGGRWYVPSLVVVMPAVGAGVIVVADLARHGYTTWRRIGLGVGGSLLVAGTVVAMAVLGG